MKQAKHRKKTVSKRKTVKRKAPVKQQMQQLPGAIDVEDLLVKSLISPSKILEDGMVIEDLVYSLTPKLARTAYKSGYSIGLGIFANSRKEENVLVAVLGKLGFRNITYYPFKDALAITSGSRSHYTTNVGARIHSFESGIIAGYLSAYSEESINTVEKECIYNGDKACRFISNTGRVFENNQSPSLEDIIDSIATNMHEIKFSSRSGAEYHMLPLMPMAREPLRSEIAKILYLSGMELSQRHPKEEAKGLLENMARYFGTAKETVSMTPKNVSIRLKYSNHNSTADFVELSTAMLRGFIKGKTSKEPNVYINIDKNMNYIVDITTAVHK